MDIVKYDPSQSDCRILELTINQVRIDESTWFWHVDIDSRKVKMVCKFLALYEWKHPLPIKFQSS